jgi:hypothetical protein
MNDPKNKIHNYISFWIIPVKEKNAVIIPLRPNQNITKPGTSISIAIRNTPNASQITGVIKISFQAFSPLLWADSKEKGI